MVEIVGSSLLDFEKSKPIEMHFFGKKSYMVVETEESVNGFKRHLFSPEELVKQLDVRIPKPEEIYRDVAFHKLDKIFGWNLTPPVLAIQHQSLGKGTIRPYLENATDLVFYRLKSEIEKDPEFWMKLAVLDYVGAVIDRNTNDILLLPRNEKLVIDSGLSFVPGTEFVTQHKIARDYFKGKMIPSELIVCINYAKNNLYNLSGLLNENNIYWTGQRIQLLLKQGIFI